MRGRLLPRLHPKNVYPEPAGKLEAGYKHCWQWSVFVLLNHLSSSHGSGSQSQSISDKETATKIKLLKWGWDEGASQWVDPPCSIHRNFPGIQKLTLRRLHLRLSKFKYTLQIHFIPCKFKYFTVTLEFSPFLHVFLWTKSLYYLNRSFSFVTNIIGENLILTCCKSLSLLTVMH